MHACKCSLAKRRQTSVVVSTQLFSLAPFGLVVVGQRLWKEGLITTLSEFDLLLGRRSICPRIYLFTLPCLEFSVVYRMGRKRPANMNLNQQWEHDDLRAENQCAPHHPNQDSSLWTLAAHSCHSGGTWLLRPGSEPAEGGAVVSCDKKWGKIQAFVGVHWDIPRSEKQEASLKVIWVCPFCKGVPTKCANLSSWFPFQTTKQTGSP